MAIIGVSGKINSGKDTVGAIIQYLVDYNGFEYKHPITEKDFNDYVKCKHFLNSNWTIVKFADKLKDIVCILLGCTREQLEDREFKETKLGEEWTKYAVADGFSKKYIGNGDFGEPVMNSKQCSKEEYEEHYRINWQTAYKTEYTPRILLQYIGTDLFRKLIHENVWVNATMIDYKFNCRPIYLEPQRFEPDLIAIEESKWIITDVRFPNEADAIKQRKGINIRLQRNSDIEQVNEHLSETALDLYQFDYVINNNGTIEELIEQVKQILIKENII